MENGFQRPIVCRCGILQELASAWTSSPPDRATRTALLPKRLKNWQLPKSETPSAFSTRGLHISLSSSTRLSKATNRKSRLLEESACRRLLVRFPTKPGNAVDPTGLEPAPSRLTG